MKVQKIFSGFRRSYLGVLMSFGGSQVHYVGSEVISGTF